MNSRGMDLSPTDIFKARIIGDLKPAAAEECAARWEDAEEALGREGFADLFLHLRMIYAKRRGEKELLKEFPDQVLSLYLPDRAEEFVNEVIEPYAEAYAQIRDRNYSAAVGAEKVNAWFKRLAQLDVNDWRPAALWALRNHGGDPERLDEFFRALERLAASMFIRRVYSTPRVTRYAELLRQLDQGQGLSSPAFHLNAGEKAETRARLDGDVHPKIRRYVLLRLDELLAASQGVTYDHALITVEHVLPQNPKLASQWTRLFDGYQRAHWTDRIGNLVLLNRTKNSQAGTYDFATKKAKYFTGRTGSVPFALTSQVLQQTKWTPKVLEHRQKELVGRLVVEWRL
ncbi:HNH endonuclease family protein [Streptomyces sp. NBC_01538]|uniref:HNH endonuclease family protein n=1 Tax=Streptomyces sp. NBC_01538 TaxID=2903897 RepID=UPI00386C51AA